MPYIKYLILGAGPAGLTIANCLKRKNQNSFLVLEKESTAGGLCRSEMVDGSFLDIGGGHFLDVRRPCVTDFLFEFMPQNEWSLFTRDSRIRLGDKIIGHPFESNIWQFGLDEQIEYLKSISDAGCNRGETMPTKFVEWISWKLGKKIADDYMIPYNQKMFSKELNELGTYWLDKLPNVSFEDTLRSCLSGKPYGTQPGHAEFYYPKKYGYGEVWLRMAERIKENIRYNSCVSKLDIKTKTVVCSDGTAFDAENIITTIPWRSIDEITGTCEGFLSDVASLKHSSVEIGYCPEAMDTRAQWIYYPEEKYPYHRILVRSNFLEGSKGYWTETRSERTVLFAEKSKYSYPNEYAYPLNTVGKPEAIKRILDYSCANKVYGLGRWGEHNHYNSDLVVEKAAKLCDELIDGSN